MMTNTFLKASDIANDQTINCNEVDLLPFCHITNGYSFEDIINAGQLNGVVCPPMDKKAIFFFYGKPKYIPSEDAFDVVGGHSPVCILFEYNSIKNNDITIFPFDSGGYHRYEAPTILRIMDFVLCSEKRNFDWSTAIRRYIKKMYGSNSSYLDISLRKELDIESRNFHSTLKFLIDLHNSIKTMKTRKFGEQATSIEVQIQADFLKLTPKVIFLPMSDYTETDKNGDLNRTPFQIVHEMESQFNVRAIFYEDKPWSIGESYMFMKIEVQKYIRENYL